MELVKAQVKQKPKKDNSVHSFSLRLGLNQQDSQSPIVVSTSIPDANISSEKDRDH